MRTWTSVPAAEVGLDGAAAEEGGCAAGPYGLPDRGRGGDLDGRPVRSSSPCGASACSTTSRVPDPRSRDGQRQPRRPGPGSAACGGGPAGREAAATSTSSSRPTSVERSARRAFGALDEAEVGLPRRHGAQHLRSSSRPAGSPTSRSACRGLRLLPPQTPPASAAAGARRRSCSRRSRSSRSRPARSAAIDASTSSATCSSRAAHSTTSVPDAVSVVSRGHRGSAAAPRPGAPSSSAAPTRTAG